jgi:hypothetical protein
MCLGHNYRFLKFILKIYSYDYYSFLLFPSIAHDFNRGIADAMIEINTILQVLCSFFALSVSISRLFAFFSIFIKGASFSRSFTGEKKWSNTLEDFHYYHG